MLIRLRNGDAVDHECVKGIRFDERLPPDRFRDSEIGPRVIIEVVTGEGRDRYPNTWVVDCDTNEEAIAYRDELIDRINAACAGVADDGSERTMAKLMS